MTDNEGRFLIPGVPGPRATLRVSLVGHRPVTRSVRVGETDLRISLAEQALALDELVVTGTAGDARQRTLGNAVAQIDAADVVAQAPVSNVQELINGRAAGVVVNQPTGMIGGGSKVRIRGLNSLSLSGAPLIYVDGVRVANDERTGPGCRGLGPRSFRA